MRDRDLRFEEEFHNQDRKQSRKDRKRAVQGDRSQFKKSDQDQLKKQTEEPVLSNDHARGRVLAVLPEGVLVSFDGEQEECHLRGYLKKEKAKQKNLIAVGDFVYADRLNSLIVSVEKRTSILSRADNLARNKEQLIAVNIDQVLITTCVMNPPLKTPLIDRYIIAAMKGNLTPIIVINKIDLLEQSNKEALLERELFDSFVSIYRSLGFLVIPLSVKTGQGIEELQNAMKGKTSVFSGQSGVGKSSLINLITSSSLETGQVVHKTNKGAHTTSAAELVPLKEGGFCIDTPGIRSFGVWDLKPEELSSYFSEIQTASKHCKFPDCAHLEEPCCAVQKAVEEGSISSLRFESYCALMHSCKQEHRKR